MNRFLIGWKALRELGPQPLLLMARYQLGLRSGWYRRQTGKTQRVDTGLVRTGLLPLPTDDQLQAILWAGSQGDESVGELLAEAEEIVAGRARLFGGQSRPLQLAPGGALEHWTRTGHTTPATAGDESAGDIKFIWEPTRFGWACTLARAYRLNGDERYAEAFWRHLEVFLQANPPYLGPNWISAQEVALRLIHLVLAAQVFAGAEQSNLPRLQRLAQAIGDHAGRIPPTLVYARAQNNNHLLSEAAALVTAGLALPDDRRAPDWLRLGRRWFRQGLLTQVSPDGEYSQHSTNYHRLALQLGLWLAAIDPEPLPPECAARLAWMTGWLQALIDPVSGETPNLGPNDGASILPLCGRPFSDYRPVLQAARAAFTGVESLSSGAGDELRLWLPARHAATGLPARSADTPCRLANPDGYSWASLRVVSFPRGGNRPGHADLLHLDLWWRGLNLASDPGTYLYNGQAPWENALTGAGVHNTVKVNGQDQMTRAGRFLYLDWAQARLVESQPGEGGSLLRVAARHDGYRRLGVSHWRMVDASCPGHWHVEDLLFPLDASLAGLHAPFRLRLHWLLPDWPWELTGSLLALQSPHGPVQLRVTCNPTGRPEQDDRPPEVELWRGGELLSSRPALPPGVSVPTLGWRAPTYGVKIQALSFAVTVEGSAPLTLTSEWILPE
jgi:hypothetical protein